MDYFLHCDNSTIVIVANRTMKLSLAFKCLLLYFLISEGVCFFLHLKQVEKGINNLGFWRLTPVLLLSET